MSLYLVWSFVFFIYIQLTFDGWGTGLGLEPSTFESMIVYTQAFGSDEYLVCIDLLAKASRKYFLYTAKDAWCSDYKCLYMVEYIEVINNQSWLITKKLKEIIRKGVNAWVCVYGPVSLVVVYIV